MAKIIANAIGSETASFWLWRFHRRSGLSHFAEKGDEVVPLKRKSPDIFDWDLSECDFDAVIHLAGEPIFARWTKEKKRRILLSRSIGTTNLAVLLLKRPPKVFISASAIGFYGDRAAEILDEESPSGVGFLPKVCREWETASNQLEAAGVRVIHARFGLVIGNGGIVQMLLNSQHVLPKKLQNWHFPFLISQLEDAIVSKSLV